MVLSAEMEDIQVGLTPHSLNGKALASLIFFKILQK